MEVDTISIEDVQQMLGARDIELFKLSRKLTAQQQEIQRLRTDLAEATKDKVQQAG